MEFKIWLFPGLEKSWKKMKYLKFWKSHRNVVIFVCSLTQFD